MTELRPRAKYWNTGAWQCCSFPLGRVSEECSVNDEINHAP